MYVVVLFHGFLPPMQITGVISLEDILETVIKADIVDEHDTYVESASVDDVEKVRGPDAAVYTKHRL